MLAHGASQVLIDGAIDRRAASSPDVADALVISTGAVLSTEIEEVVERTRDAVELARLEPLEASAALSLRLRELGARTALLDEQGEHELGPRFVLTADAPAIIAALDDAPDAELLAVGGALPERFLVELVRVLRRRGRELTVVVADATHAFLTEHGPSWYERQGARLRAQRPIAVRALTVNPVAPQSHDHDAGTLVEMLELAIPSVPVFDVMDPDYRAMQPAAHSASGAADAMLPPVARRGGG
jgi:hypothetical protein